jgi:cell wall assembly regulator SMI1
MDRWLAVHRPDYYALLQPGATDAQLDAFARDRGL